MSAVRLRNWQTGYPDAGRVVWVWAAVTSILGTWDGSTWRTLDGQQLPERVAYWYERR